MRVPINYGGNAFSKAEDVNEEKDNTDSTDLLRESQNDIEPPVDYQESSNHQENTPDLLADNTKSESAPVAPASIFKGFGNNSLFGGRIGSEELLILALVFLLSDTDADNDIIWLLLLLLFIK